jgi:hypothetical protein
MFGKNKIHVTYFEDDKKENTEKAFFGRISEAIKTGEENGKATYNFESWNARFVGKARAKADSLTDKQSITITEWSCRNPYDKERKKNFPYVVITDFEIANEQGNQEG